MISAAACRVTPCREFVGASLDVIERDAKRMRGSRPFVFTNIRTGQGLDDVVRFTEVQGGLA